MKYVLALSRTGSIAATARALGVNETTVSRRIQMLERHFQQSLFVRSSGGTQVLSDVGLALVRHAIAFENEAEAIIETIDGARQNLSGTVRITSVPVLVNRILVPALKPLLEQNPNIEIELIPDGRNFNLTQREADIAIRLARPLQGGFDLNLRRIGHVQYGVFCKADIDLDENHVWVGYDETSAYLPQAKWLANLSKSNKFINKPIKVCDTETAIEVAACGLGKAILPINIAKRDHRLRQIAEDMFSDLPKRDVWLLSHSKQSNLKVIQVAMNWICGLEW